MKALLDAVTVTAATAQETGQEVSTDSRILVIVRTPRPHNKRLTRPFSPCSVCVMAT